MNVTALEQGPAPFAPALIHAICRVANRLSALRVTEQAGEVGYWEEIWPAYTVFHPDSETFSVLWTEYHPDFEMFLERYRADVEQYGDQPVLFPKGPSPAHARNIAIAPWLDFTAFNLDYGREYLMPVFTAGHCRVGDGRVLLPLAMQANHAACDGWHVTQFFAGLGEETTRK
ncbi:MAG: CatA-like O-acetyltransferase [Deinococcus sp.]|uniref:CatA-like O-acetyltransferase n=1 Tax=Deinococcus sp. TaxID=47478 RepID=UPI0026DB3F76|nr:CatA-like O-acetyltransferase [Deinococcus sp.]MDO4246672.1 CatA-like O-acetyltransferase [Deinococcus sp.]